MVFIEYYMNDGANWQAQGVLAYLRSMKEFGIEKTWNEKYHCYDAKINVGRYENCREQGYIFSVNYLHQQRNYCVYEHRNSDILCVVVFDGVTIDTPPKEMVHDAMNDNKWNYTKSFDYGQIVECGDYVLNDMKDFIEELLRKQ